MNTVYGFDAKRLGGDPETLEAYKGKVLLIVNTASKCGFTPQYAGLQELYDKLHGEGLEILGFPCNQFGAQEPGSAEDISGFCQLNYGVTFPMFDKVEVNGDGAHPLFKHLKAEAPGLLGSQGIKWNFTKFLVNREGKVVARFAPTATPASLEAEIRKLL